MIKNIILSNEINIKYYNAIILQKCNENILKKCLTIPQQYL